MINIGDISFIEEHGVKKAVLISMTEFKTMQKHLEELQDLREYNYVVQSNEEKFPHDIVKRILLSDESNIRIIREYRGINMTTLAKTVEISEPYLSQIETGKRKGDIYLYKNLARALDVDIDILVD
jgi:DNA-binding XRE family transcriptional regulator